MNKLKIYFCLFLCLLSFLYIKDNLSKLNILNYLVDSDEKVLTTTKKVTKLSSTKEKVENKDPIVYFYNTHETEEYKENAYNITPTVKTVSNILSEELESKKIYSIVEENSIKKGLDKYGYDYSGAYEISLNYLKDKVKKYNTLKYYFDIHRDSVKGKYSRVTINNKSYAKIMFLIGKNHDNYKKNLSNVKIMENYLNKHYEGILRDTYYQPLYAYNQDYKETMFLVEFGGVDNTLEELYNSSRALAEAIEYYIEIENEK